MNISSAFFFSFEKFFLTHIFDFSTSVTVCEDENA